VGKSAQAMLFTRKPVQIDWGSVPQDLLPKSMESPAHMILRGGIGSLGVDFARLAGPVLRWPSDAASGEFMIAWSVEKNDANTGNANRRWSLSADRAGARQRNLRFLLKVRLVGVDGGRSAKCHQALRVFPV